MDDTAQAIHALIDYLRLKEIRETIGSDTGYNKFNDQQTLTKIKYQAALESGDDQDFVRALEESPVRYPFVAEEMERRQR